MSLFQKMNFIGHAGQPLDFKIECDDLTYEDIECCAYLLSKRVPSFTYVKGIPRGGLRLADAMRKYAVIEDTPPRTLYVDDVYTTGTSFKVLDKEAVWWGAVIFDRSAWPARPDKISALFQMTGER